MMIMWNGREWAIVDEDGCEVRELQCGDVLDVRWYDDDDAPWLSVRIGEDQFGLYMVGPDGQPRDDFDLWDVRQ